jgi:copper chaperone
MSVQTFSVTGMTCGHCVNAVSAELGHLPGVSEVAVDLDADGVSTVRVITEVELTDAQVAEALDEAGDYHLAPAG